MPRSCLSLTSLALTPQAVPPKACSHRPRTPCRLAPRRLHGCPPTQPLSSASYSRAARGVTMSARPVRTAAAASELPSVSVSVDQLRSAIWRALKQQKHSDADAAALLDVILYAQLRDNSQGVIKVTTGASARDPDARELVVEHETKLSARLDGRLSSGALVMLRAAHMAADKAAAHGFGIVGTHGTASSSMALGFFARQIAQRGLIAVVLAQSPEYVAPHGAAVALYGTNPIAVGIPSAGDAPLVLDMATSAYSWWGVMECATAGRPLPAGVAQDADGAPTVDPQAVLSGGALLSFDRSHKGSALGLIVELLAGPLAGAAVKDKAAARNWGNLVLAVDPALLGSAEEFRNRVADVLARVKAAPCLPGVRHIALPGERGDTLAADRLAQDRVPMEGNLWAALEELAAQSDDASAPPPHARGISLPLPAAATASLGPGTWKLATLLVHSQVHNADPYASVTPPLYQTATFEQPSATTFGPYDYTRSGNPTRTLLEGQMAELEGAHRAFAFTSGMAALTAVTRLVRSGQRVLSGDDIYGGTSRLLSQVLPKLGIAVTHVDMTDLAAVQQAMTDDVRLVMIESPTNPRLRITDIRGVCAAAKAVGALVCVDNSIMAAMYQSPLALGADICMTSATKFIGGHSDLMAGILAVKGADIASELYFHQNAEGTALAPFDCWLTLRGVKTMALRMGAAQENATALARFLAAHPLVRRVNFPGLPGHPGAALHASQASGAGSILSFETGNLEVSRRIVERTKLFKVTVSFGGCSSLISLPCFMSHASIPADVRAARGLPDDLVRISAGIEDAQDLIADLAAAMAFAARPAASAEPVADARVAAPLEEGAIDEQTAAVMARIRELEARLSK